MSNVNQAGVWVFHLGPWPALQNIKQPDINLTPGNVFSNQSFAVKYLNRVTFANQLYV